MSEVTCNTIRDILPLYVDGVVSDDTRNMVTKHLERCEECRKKYEAMKSEIVIPVEDNVAPLKHFKKVWKKKKIILVCSTILATVAIMFCALFIFNHFAYQDKIAVNGAIYTQKGENITALPADSIELGYLRSITHRSTSDPSVDYTAVNLDEKYAGCMIYQSENGEVIYLEDYNGYYIPFVLNKYITQAENE
ncbi:MAG: zf-HC2 domain-containing protein [Clostridiales bacterium]|nr:zf-HC2 domain-containing protein [Clostridiales bacterium]